MRIRTTYTEYLLPIVVLLAPLFVSLDGWSFGG
jgi:hypothetical protein